MYYPANVTHIQINAKYTEKILQLSVYLLRLRCCACVLSRSLVCIAKAKNVKRIQTCCSRILYLVKGVGAFLLSTSIAGDFVIYGQVFYFFYLRLTI